MSAEAVPQSETVQLPHSWLDRITIWGERGSEYLNPILVKEGRQALKSRHFVVTFMLVLFCAWIWTLLGVASNSPGIYYLPAGRGFLIGYYLVLAIPALVVVPFMAFRSLAGEREDGTFELLSITTMSSRQIVYGKLGSAVIQTLVYFCAIAPCIAFTYLLSGIDILTIGLTIGLLFLASILFSSGGLLVGTASRSKLVMVLLSVLTVIALLIGGGIVTFWQLIMLSEQPPYDDVGFWAAMGALVSFSIAGIVLLVNAAAASITFASENRSTRLRAIMLVIGAMIIGWWCFPAINYQQAGVVQVIPIFCLCYWGLMGSFIVGERGALSPRVRRSLPRSTMGRVFLAWFCPGSGAGYFFVVANVIGASIFAAVLYGAADIFDPDTSAFAEETLTVCIVTPLYAISYLGFVRLFAQGLNRLLPLGILLSFFLGIVVLVVGSIVPWALQALLGPSYAYEYSALQASNPFWTYYRIIDGEFYDASILPGDGLSGGGFVVLLALFCFSVLMALLNVLTSLDEILAEREEAPVRVEQDEKELHPKRYASAATADPFAHLERPRNVSAGDAEADPFSHLEKRNGNGSADGSGPADAPIESRPSAIEDPAG
ncbi:MAG TPA: hypothetical protein VGN57_03860 [Pirellulaceae bacterium]|nr:hypothetical protein [Pirellulaceae bacterium]